MPVSTPKSVLSQLEAWRVDPVYLLLGDDDVAKASLLAAFDALVPEDVRGFNLQKYHATDPRFDLVGVLAAARTLPFLGGRRVVELLRAEVILKPKKKSAELDELEGEPGRPGAEDETEQPSSATAELEAYLGKPSPDTCLVIVAADLHRGTRLGRVVLKLATVVEFWGLGDEEGRGRDGDDALSRAARYVQAQVRQEGQSIDPDAVARVLLHAGTDLATLRADVQRVLTYAAGKAEITEEDVRAVVSGEVSHDDWAMVRGIESGDVAFALRQLHLMIEGGGSPYQILGQIGWWVRDPGRGLPARTPGRVPAAVRAVFETDLALKTSRGDPQVLLERLIVELCQERSGKRVARGPLATPRSKGR